MDGAVTRDGAAWCFLALERGKQGYGAQPVHKAGFDWKRTANSLLEAWRAKKHPRIADVTCEGGAG